MSDDDNKREQMMHIRLSSELHRRLRIKAAMEGTSIRKLVEAALVLLVSKKKVV